MNGNLAALVTGSSSGIGRDIARSLARRGYHLVVTARRRDRLQKLKLELEEEFNIRCFVFTCDLSKFEEVSTLMPQVLNELSKQNLTLKVLVNNAGSGIFKNFSEVPMDIFKRDIDLNILALTTLCCDFVKYAKELDDETHILNIASLAAFFPVPQYSVYAATKAYVKSLSEILEYELRESPINVTCIFPGGVKTEFLKLAGQELNGEIGMMNSQEVAELSVLAMEKKKSLYIPGIQNRFSFLLKLFPRKLRPMVIEKSMSMTVTQR